MKHLFSILLFIPSVLFSQSIIEVGSNYQGGIVFYVDSEGKGLIIDTDYLQASYTWIDGQPLQSRWGNHWVNNINAQEEFIGAGQFNTTNLTISNINDFAADVCINSNSSGYTDWFLPSKNELWEIMMQKSIIDSVIQEIGGDTIYDAYHWSSTQASISNAWVAYPTSTFLSTGEAAGPSVSPWTKSHTALVRGIRCIDNDCSFMGSPIFGCTDSIAENYNPDAAANDFSCEYIEGCTDENACNYDILVTMHNSILCDYNCHGCTDSSAVNYLGSSVTIDDGSCLYCFDTYHTIYVTYDSLIDNSVFFMINNGDIAFTNVTGTDYYEGFCMPNGCYQLYMFANCNISDNWIGNTIEIGDFSYTINSVETNMNFYLGNGDCIYGCTDSTFIEFNPLATFDDSTCANLIIYGCIDFNACNFNVDANIDDGSCTYPTFEYFDCSGNCISDFDLDGECDEVDYDDGIGIEELDEESPQVIKMIDILGREQHKHKKGSLLFYIYDNGVVEKLIIN